MASLCPPAELVSHILTTLAFSGQTGLLLLELWREVAAKLDLDSIDDFQKQIIWLWLFFKDAAADDLVIHHNNIQQAVTPKYPDMFNETGVSEESLQVYPSSDTQWKHLTMTDNYSQIKTQLGDLPFQLLCVIAKFGPSGVITPTLCKLSGQDPRSIGGKYKFIRLFAREFVDAQDAKPANEKPIKDTIQKLNLPKLNQKFLTKIKPITGPLLEKKVMEKKAPEKKRQTSSTTPETTKRQKRGRGRPTAAELKQKAEEEEREKQEEMKRQEEISHQQQLKQEQQQQQHDEPIAESNPIEETIYHIKAADMPAPRIVKKGPSKKNRVTNPTPIPTSDKSISIKSLKRRECIVDLIKKNGGVQYTSSNFVRDIDVALGNKQTTDNKTIARDISELIKNETLEVEPFVITRGTLTFHKKLLILKGLNPSPETLEKVKTKCINEKTHGSQAALPKTVNKTLHIFSKDSLASSNIGKNRLKSLNSKDNHQLEKASKRKSRKTKVKEDPDGENNKESSGKRKRKIKRTAANAEGDENDFSSTSQNDPLLSVVSKGRRKPGTKKKKKSMFVSAPKMRKFRSTLKFDKSDATILFRAVIIRKSLRKTALDFEEIGSFIGINNAKEAKRKWNSTRRIIGGQAALERGTQSFEQIVMKGIANGLISEKDLIDCDLQFFLDLWRDFDSSELEIVDKTPLFTTIEQNRENYDIVKSYENDTDLYDTLEDNSMRQKELILSAYVASYKENESIKPDEYEELRTLIKSIVATSEENFSGDQLKKLLENHSQEDIEKVMTQLINDKVVQSST
ncbi:hypothetical protein QCA50_009397 [Cerrena zonata]|uniref:Uncharacterized protein n=1 Tax=Cerrena zonata TaxID=2478898 RepID=A0AAW0GER4_9APHY